jgi:hypothetical protein
MRSLDAFAEQSSHSSYRQDDTTTQRGAALRSRVCEDIRGRLNPVVFRLSQHGIWECEWLSAFAPIKHGKAIQFPKRASQIPGGW